MFEEGNILINNLKNNTTIVKYISKQENKEAFIGEVIFSEKNLFIKGQLVNNLIIDAFYLATIDNVPKNLLTEELKEMIYLNNMNMVELLNKEKIILKKLPEDKKHKYIIKTYKDILEYVYGKNNDNVDFKLNVAAEDTTMINIETNKKALIEIRNDILSIIKNEIDYFIGEY